MDNKKILAFAKKHKTTLTIVGVGIGLLVVFKVAKAIMSNSRNDDSKDDFDSEKDFIVIEESPLNENISVTKDGVIIDDYDKDFDYVKRNGVWYVRSKPNAKTIKNRTLYKDWFSLEGNKVATDKLNKVYPLF